MLVFSRKEGEGFRINKNIVVRIIKIKEDKVRIGVEAPPDVKILREELQDFDENASDIIFLDEDEKKE